MATIRCTKKLLNELPMKSIDETTLGNSIDSWHANLLWIDRRKCVLFTNDITLFSFLVPGLKKPDFQRFEEVFRLNLYKNLEKENISDSLTEDFLNLHRHVYIGKTNNRSVLGSMNDLAYQLKTDIYYDGGLSQVDMTSVNYELNRVPMKAIKYSVGIEEFINHLSSVDT